MAAYLILLILFLSPLFTLTSQNQEHEIVDAKPKIARLESILEESLQKLDAKIDYLKKCDNLIDDLAVKIADLQSLLYGIKDDSSLVEEKASGLEEQMADIANEQWIQIQHLEPALHMTEMRALNIQRKLRLTRCTLLKFVNDLSEKHLPMLFGIFNSYFSGGGSTLSSYVSQAEQQFKRSFLAFKKFHHELQVLIKQEMEKNESTAVLVNEELIFFAASALITFPILTAWMLLSSKFS